MVSAGKHYGIVDDIAEGELGAATGNLSVSAVLASSVHDVESTIVVGSTSTSAIDLAQFALTAEQAIKLGALIVSAGQEALSANRLIEMKRRHGPAAVRLCIALANASRDDVLVNQNRMRLGYSFEAQQLAEQAYDAASKATPHAVDPDDWRRIWREAGELLGKEVGHV